MQSVLAIFFADISRRDSNTSWFYSKKYHTLAYRRRLVVLLRKYKKIKMANALFIDNRKSLDSVILAPGDNYMFFLHDGKIILYQNQTLTEIYITGMVKAITGEYLLPEKTERCDYVFRYLDDGKVKFILSVYYKGYYSAKPGGDDDRFIEVNGYYNLTDKCVASYEFPDNFIQSMEFQATYKSFYKVHAQLALEKQKKLISETKSEYPETRNYSDQEVLSFLETLYPL
jgi:hypothetical protein